MENESLLRSTTKLSLSISLTITLRSHSMISPLAFSMTAVIIFVACRIVFSFLQSIYWYILTISVSSPFLLHLYRCCREENLWSYLLRHLQRFHDNEKLLVCLCLCLLVYMYVNASLCVYVYVGVGMWEGCANFFSPEIVSDEAAVLDNGETENGCLPCWMCWSIYRVSTMDGWTVFWILIGWRWHF